MPTPRDVHLSLHSAQIWVVVGAFGPLGGIGLADARCGHEVKDLLYSGVPTTGGLARPTAPEIGLIRVEPLPPE